MENQNKYEDLHHILGIVDQNIKEIAKSSNQIILEEKASPKVSPAQRQHDIWESNNLRLEMEEEKSEPHRSTQNIISK